VSREEHDRTETVLHGRIEMSLAFSTAGFC